MTTFTHRVIAAATLVVIIIASPIALLCPLLELVGLHRASALVALPFASALSFAQTSMYKAKQTDASEKLMLDAHILLCEVRAAGK